MVWSGGRSATLCSLSRIAVKMSVLLKMSSEATRPKQQKQYYMKKKKKQQLSASCTMRPIASRHVVFAQRPLKKRKMCATAYDDIIMCGGQRWQLQWQWQWQLAAGSWLTAAAITATAVATVAAGAGVAALLTAATPAITTAARTWKAAVASCDNHVNDFVATWHLCPSSLAWPRWPAMRCEHACASRGRRTSAYGTYVHACNTYSVLATYASTCRFWVSRCFGI